MSRSAAAALHVHDCTQIAPTPRLTYTMRSDAVRACAACVRRPSSFHIVMFELGWVPDLTCLPVSSVAECSWLITTIHQGDQGGRKLWRRLRGARLASSEISNPRPGWATPLRQRVPTPRTCPARQMARNHKHDAVRWLIACKDAPSGIEARGDTCLRLAGFRLGPIGRLRAGAPHPVALWIAADRWIWRLRRLLKQALTRGSNFETRSLMSSPGCPRECRRVPRRLQNCPELPRGATARR